MRVKGNLKILLCCLAGYCNLHANAQQASILQPSAYSLKDSVNFAGTGKKNMILPGWKPVSGEIIPFRPVLAGLPQSDYFTRQWGIFCEGEWRLEKKTGIPLRFRLGSLDYVNRLEGKPGSKFW